jgi:hypothetical protein
MPPSSTHPHENLPSRLIVREEGSRESEFLKMFEGDEGRAMRR